MQNPQVRERAYFFIGSYYIIMYWVGFGVWGLITDVRDWLAEKGRTRFMAPVSVIMMIVFATLIPASVFSNHIDEDFNQYQVHDRTHDWAPWDYGHNILTSCEPDAILFTNGDNDTFPLWYIQEVIGLRKDVRVVNLSLLNTDWYILQMKHEEPVITIKYSDEYITETLCGHTQEAINKRLWPPEGRTVEAAGIQWDIPPYQTFDLQQGQRGILRVQDVMVYNIINWTNWERPIYFASTVAQGNKIGLQSHLAMEGMVYKLVPDQAPPGGVLVHAERLNENLFDKYKFRSLSDPEIYKPPNTRQLITNYYVGFAQLAQEYVKMGKGDDVVRVVRAGLLNSNTNLEKRILLYRLTHQAGHLAELKDYIVDDANDEQFINGRMGALDQRLFIASFLDTLGENELAEETIEREENRVLQEGAVNPMLFMRMLVQLNLDEYAVDFINTSLERNPANVEMLRTSVGTMISLGKTQEAYDLLQSLKETNAGVDTVQRMIQMLEKQIAPQIQELQAESSTTN
jgi:hypothetical protein